MKWASLYIIWLLLLVPVFIFLFARAESSRRKALSTLGDANLLKSMSIGLSEGRRKLKALLVLTAITLIIIASARPQFGVGLKEMRTSGRDILFVLDISKSMLAQDIAPSRLQSAKSAIKGLLDEARGDKVGLVIFAGEAFLQCPLTVDYSAMKLFLDAVDVDSIPLPGTNIADAIQEGMKAFSKAQSTSKIMVLITDGEDHSGKAIEVAKEAGKQNIRIYTIGIGNPAGAPIPIRDENGNLTYKKDEQGNTIMSALDEVTLQKIALETGGKYYFAGSQLELKKVYEHIAGNKGGISKEERFYTHYEDKFQWLLFPALLLLLLDTFLDERKRKRNKVFAFFPKRALGILILCLPLLMAFGGPVVEGVRRGNQLFKEGNFGDALASYLKTQVLAPDDPRISYNIGTAYYKQGKYAEAREAFLKTLSTPDNSLREMAFYNLGNCYFKEAVTAGDIELLSKAVKNYEKALELNPNDEDAKYNLEVARRMIELKKKENTSPEESATSQQPNQQQQGQQQSQQQQQQKGKDQEAQSNQRESASATSESHLKPAEPSTKEMGIAQQNQQSGEMGKEEAERILQALEDRERENLKERMMPSYGQRPYVLKDW